MACGESWRLTDSALSPAGKAQGGAIMSARTPGPITDPAYINMGYRQPDECRRVLAMVAVLLDAPTNRMGKPEYYQADTVQAREEVRLLAVKYNVGPSDTVAHQAAKVVRAALAKVEG
jgi:hypothetical protein